MIDVIVYVAAIVGGLAFFQFNGRKNVKNLGEPYLISPSHTKRRLYFSGVVTVLCAAGFAAHYFITQVEINMFFTIIVMIFFGVILSLGINTLVMAPAKLGIYENGIYGIAGAHLFEDIESCDFDYPMTSTTVAIMNFSKRKSKLVKPNVYIDRDDVKKLKKYVNGRIKDTDKSNKDDNGNEKFSYANIKNLKP